MSSMTTERESTLCPSALLMGGGGWVVLSLALMVSGCQSSAQSASFAASSEVTFGVARQVLTEISGAAPAEMDSGKLRSEWREEVSSQQQGLLQRMGVRRRSRYIVTVSGDERWSDVEVVTHFEERPPGGRRAYRWRRLPSAELGNAFLVRLGKGVRAALSAQLSTSPVEGAMEGDPMSRPSNQAASQPRTKAGS